MTEPPRPRRPLFRGWWVVSGAMAVQGLQAALFHGAFGVYAPFWMAEFGWSRTTISLIHSLQRTESGLLGPVNGWLVHRYGPQRMTIIGLGLMGLAMVGLGFATGFATFVAAFLVMAVGASFSGFLSLMTVVVNWFERRRATAMALVGLGMSIGGLTAPLLAWLIESYGWRGVSVGSGVLFLAMMLPLGRLLVGEPEALGMRPDGEAATAEPDEGASDPAGAEATGDATGAEADADAIETSGKAERADDQAGRDDANARGAATSASGAAAARSGSGTRSMARHALRSRAFWLISIGHSNALAIVGAVGVHFVIYAQEVIGLSVTAAATLLMVVTLCQMVGQASGGVLGDRLDKRWVAGSGMLLHAAAMLTLTLMPSLTGAVVAAVMHGLGWGMRGPLMSALRADYFGRAAFAMVMGLSSLIVTVGSVLGPLAVGLLADGTGGYSWGFGLLAVVGLLGAVAFLALEKPPARVSVVART